MNESRLHNHDSHPLIYMVDLFVFSTYHFRASSRTGLEVALFPVIRCRPLVALNVLGDSFAVAAHADHLSTALTLSWVARPQTNVGAAFRPRLLTSLLTLATVSSSL